MSNSGKWTRWLAMLLVVCFVELFSGCGDEEHHDPVDERVAGRWQVEWKFSTQVDYFVLNFTNGDLVGLEFPEGGSGQAEYHLTGDQIGIYYNYDTLMTGVVSGGTMSGTVELKGGNNGGTWTATRISN